jgi:Tol biopolymer transport system component
MYRFRTTVGALAVLTGLACSDGPFNPATEPSPTAEPPRLTLRKLMVSNAVAASAVGMPPITAVGTGGGETAAYVSLPAGTLPGMVSALIRNTTTGSASSSIPVIDGGFDPVPILGAAGDELELTFTDASGWMFVAYAIIPSESPPTVVRTNPPRGRTDVALSVIVTVVFSEPIDPGTLAEGVKLLSGGADVAASVYLLPDQPWTAELMPAALLEPGTTYELQVATEVRDLDGDALGETFTATFTTESEPPAGAIAFVSDRDGTPHIYVADPDGSNVRRLAEGQEPAWSWDGRKIAFVRWPSSGTNSAGIYVMNPDGTEPTYVGPGFSPTWSPDGRITFTQFGGWMVKFVGIMDADGSDAELLVYDPTGTSGSFSSLTRATWSPDGRNITFSSGSNVWIADPRGSNLRELEELRGRVSAPAWSPDGSMIASITDPGLWQNCTSQLGCQPGSGFEESSVIRIFRLAAAELEVIDAIHPTAFVRAANPEWSPDGSRLIFDLWDANPSSLEDFGRRIYTVSLETGAVRQLIPDAIDAAVANYSDWGAVWSRPSR